MLLQFTSQSAANETNTLQQDLDTLQTWEHLWDMDFNPTKYRVLHITKFRHAAQHIYMLHGQALEAADHAKYLGVDISKDLGWNTHINRIIPNANRTLKKEHQNPTHRHSHSSILNTGPPTGRIHL